MNPQSEELQPFIQRRRGETEELGLIGTSPEKRASQVCKRSSQRLLPLSVVSGFGPGRGRVGGANTEGCPGAQGPQVRPRAGPVPPAPGSRPQFDLSQLPFPVLRELVRRFETLLRGRLISVASAEIEHERERVF